MLLLALRFFFYRFFNWSILQRKWIKKIYYVVLEMLCGSTEQLTFLKALKKKI